MTQEEKAKAYDEAIKRAKEAAEKGMVSHNFVSDIFPELAESEDEKIRKALIEVVKESSEILEKKNQERMIAWLEKQGEQKPLYIRFGDMPSNGKSKIYGGEDEEIGEEDGVSVYPAFEADGNIVLGLTLPITKTTLYTQQHLLEYDDRPCYLVSGDRVGKGTDGEPLIRNVSVIKRLDNYRIKEPANEPEQKFEIGDLITDGVLVGKIDEIHEHGYHAHFRDHYADVPDAGNWHKWTIRDAKDGDVLSFDNENSNYHSIGIFKRMASKNEPNGNTYRCHVMYGGFKEKLEIPKNGDELHHCGTSAHPATEKQRGLLFSKMKEAGYEWDADTKKLKKVGQNPADKVGPHFHVEEGKWYVCIRPFALNGNIVVSKGRTYKSREDNAISGEGGRLFIDNHDGDASEYFRPWTIRNAKPGDVVYHRSPLTGTEYVVMFRGVNGYGGVGSYFRYNSDDGFGINIPSVFSAESDITPATEEQRGLLFSKMKEAGYEWDADKKELKRIGQNHTGWSLPYGKKETAEKLIALAECLEMAGDCLFDGLSGDDYGKLLRTLAELIEANPAWGEEDEKMLAQVTNEIEAIKSNSSTVFEKNIAQDKIDWLKSIKDRVKK
jgi:hypothetical protein